MEFRIPRAMGLTIETSSKPLQHRLSGREQNTYIGGIDNQIRALGFWNRIAKGNQITHI